MNNRRGKVVKQGGKNGGFIVPSKKQLRNQTRTEVGIPAVASNVKRSFVAPPSREINLKFTADFQILTNTGNNYAGKQFRANNLYDVDDQVLTSSVAGYAENMVNYSYCLPISCDVSVTFVNQETFPVNIAIAATVDEPNSLFSSAQNLRDIAENSLSVGPDVVGGNASMNKRVMKLFVNFAELNGNVAEYYGNAENYSSGPATNVPYTMWLSLLAWASQNFSSSTGLRVAVDFCWRVKLWAKRIVLDSGPSLREIARLRAELEQEEDPEKRKELEGAQSRYFMMTARPEKRLQK